MITLIKANDNQITYLKKVFIILINDSNCEFRKIIFIL